MPEASNQTFYLLLLDYHPFTIGILVHESLNTIEWVVIALKYNQSTYQLFYQKLKKTSKIILLKNDFISDFKIPSSIFDIIIYLIKIIKINFSAIRK